VCSIPSEYYIERKNKKISERYVLRWEKQYAADNFRSEIVCRFMRKSAFWEDSQEFRKFITISYEMVDKSSVFVIIDI